MRPSSILAVLVVLAASAARADAPEKDWSGSAGAGAILLTGNTRTTTVNGAASVQRQTDGWILAAKATGVYGRTRPVDRTQPAQTVALAASGQLRGDRKLGEHATVFALGGADTDHVASVEYRAYGEAGLGWIWLDRKAEGDRTVFLRTDLGGRYAYESRWQYYATAAAPQGDLDDVELVAPRAGLAFRLGLSKDVQFSEEAEVLAKVGGSERWLARSLAKLSSRLYAAVTAGVSYAVTYDSAPAPGKVRTDTALGVTFEVAF